MVNLCNCSHKSCRKWHPKIEKAIRAEMAAATRNGETYLLNMSRLARLCDISRPTLYEHELFIEQLRRSLEIDRQRSEGHAQVQSLKEELERRNARISSLEDQVAGLHRGIAQLYSTLYLTGVSTRMIDEGLMPTVCDDLESCPLRRIQRLQSSENVVELDRRKERTD